MEKKEMSKGVKATLFGVKSIIKILIYVIIVIFIVNICRGAISFGYQVFHQEAMASPEEGVDVTVEIPVGASAAEIGSILKDNDLIENGTIFILQEYLSNYHGKIEGGIYVLNTSQTPDEMIAIMAGVEETK